MEAPGHPGDPPPLSDAVVNVCVVINYRSSLLAADARRPESSNPFDEPEPYPDNNVSIDDMRRQQQQIIAGVYLSILF